MHAGSLDHRIRIEPRKLNGGAGRRKKQGQVLQVDRRCSDFAVFSGFAVSGTSGGQFTAAKRGETSLESNFVNRYKPPSQKVCSHSACEQT